MRYPDIRLVTVPKYPLSSQVHAVTHPLSLNRRRAWLSVLSRSQRAPWAHAQLRKSDSTLPLWLSHLQNAPQYQYLACNEDTVSHPPLSQ